MEWEHILTVIEIAVMLGGIAAFIFKSGSHYRGMLEEAQRMRVSVNERLDRVERIAIANQRAVEALARRSLNDEHGNRRVR